MKIQRELNNGEKIDVTINKQLVENIKVYANVTNEITKARSKEQIPLFSTSNIVGEWAELLVCNALNLVQQAASKKDYDATGEDGVKYQIKSRWYRSYLKEECNRHGQEEFGSIDINGKFNKLLLVYFEDDLSKPFRVLEVEKKNIKKLNKMNNKLFYKKKDKYAFHYCNLDNYNNKLATAIKDNLIKDITKDYKW